MRYPQSVFSLLSVFALANCVAAASPRDGGTSADASGTAPPMGDDAAQATDDSGSVTDDSGPTSDDASVAATCVAGPVGTAPALVPGQWTNISPPGFFRPRQPVPPFGCMDIHVHPCSPYVLYLTTDIQGMWRSADGGATWTQIGNLPTPVSPGVMQIDPKNALNMYYGGGVRGSSLGFWVSRNGGATWAQPAGFTARANNSVGGWVNDVYVVEADPTDFKHVLLTFHSPWDGNGAGNAGVLETMDGGNTWVRHSPAGPWGAGHSAFFLGDRRTWLLGTQVNGYWRTADGGATWKQVSTQNMQHGAVQPYYSAAGVLYVGAVNQILRSTDNGLTFTSVGPHTPDGYYSVIGDGNFLYTQLSNTGNNTSGMQPYVTSMDADGVTWNPYNGQTFDDGPYRMAFDSVNRIIYSANWSSGVWALKVN